MFYVFRVGWFRGGFVFVMFVREGVDDYFVFDF